MQLFASAQPADTSGSLGIMLACIFILAAAAALAVPPIRISRHRNHRFADAILAGTLLWSALAAGSAIVTLLTQYHYSQQHNLAMMSGLSDPLDLSDQPPYPWLLWLGLVVAYGLLLLTAAAGKKTPRNPEPPADEPMPPPPANRQSNDPPQPERP